MAKYDIKHTCGHVVTHQIAGTNINGERDQKEAWLKTTVCKECYRQQQDKIAAEKNKGLPELKGSPKQIAWAESIRAKAVDSLASVKELIKNDHPQSAAAYKVIDDVLNNDQAKYWIDNRNVLFDANWVGKETIKQLDK